MSGEIGVEPVEGTEVHWYWKYEDDERYSHESAFISESLYASIDQPSIIVDEASYDEETFQEYIEPEARQFDLSMAPYPPDIDQMLPEMVQAALQDTGIPRDTWWDVLLSAELTHALRMPTNVVLYQRTFSGRNTVYSASSFASMEQQLRQSETNLATAPSDPRYSGPLFAYQLDKGDDQTMSSSLKLRGPLNVAWKSSLNKNTSDVTQEMEANGWGTPFATNYNTRYAIVKKPSGAYGLDAHSDQTGTPDGIPPEIWHCRMFSVPSTMDTEFKVAGQAHWDNFMHHTVLSTSRKFSQSRTQVTSDWTNWNYNCTNTPIGNGANIASSKGIQGQIEP